MSVRSQNNSEENFSRHRLYQVVLLVVLLSVIPTMLVVFTDLKTLSEVYFVMAIYTTSLFMLGFLYLLKVERMNYNEMKAFIKKEGIISEELVKINTEEKLKNILSLEFERCYDKNSESSIIFFDIDDLSIINRQYGFNTGDQVIIQLILTMRKYISESERIRNTGAMVARIKGDTFALVMPDVTAKDAYIEAEHLKMLIDTMKWGIHQAITCRFVVLPMNQWSSEDKFLELAYEKLHMAKDYGKGVIL